MEHCGDDFLAALAESNANSEEWDDLQAAESEACGALTGIIGKQTCNGHKTDNKDTFGGNVFVIEDSPERPTDQNYLDVDSSSEGEEDLLSPEDVRVQYRFTDLNSCRNHQSKRSSSKHPLESAVSPAKFLTIFASSLRNYCF